jgi:hypothetical protein
MYKVLFAALLSLSSISAYAGLFGPSDGRECLLKNQDKVRLQDARQVLIKACVFGYEDGDFDKEAVKIGRCIASEAKSFYSFDSTLKVINSCTRKNTAYFNYFKNQLYSDLEDRIALESNKQNIRRRLELEEKQNGPVTIFDSATGTYKHCQRAGGTITCF